MYQKSLEKTIDFYSRQLGHEIGLNLEDMKTLNTACILIIN